MNEMINTCCHFLLIAFIIAACSKVAEESSTVTDAGLITVTVRQFQSANMALGTISRQAISSEINARGHIEVPPSSKASVSPFYSGYVKKINVLPGEQVQAGDVLLLLQNPEFLEVQQEYLEAKEQLSYLEDDFNRQKQLSEENISSQKRFLKAEADYRATLARYQSLREQLRLMNVSVARVETGQLQSTIPIYSPINGYVTEIFTNLSAFVPASRTAVEIINTEHIHLDLSVFERDIPYINVNQRIRYTVPEFGVEQFEGVVSLVGKSVNLEERTVPVHGHLKEEDESRFVPGMFVEATIEISSDSSLCVPREAVVEVDNTSFIAAVQHKDSLQIFFEALEVTVGNENETWLEIVNAEKLKGREILIKGAFSIL